MVENQVQTPAADKPQLFSGTFLSIVFFLTYFSVFGINWLSALLFAALSVSVIRHLCQNEPGKGLACTASARLQIIKSCFADVQYPIEPGLPELLAECTGNFTGADLKGFAQKVKQRAFARNIRMYDRALFQECLSGIYPNSHKELLHQIREWEAQRNNQKEGNE